MRTREDVITKALRLIGHTAVDETPDADAAADAIDTFDGLTVQFQEHVPGDGFWSNIPERVYLPMAHLVAATVAPNYNLQAPMSREMAMSLIMAQLRPDDRDETEAVYY